MYVGTSFLADGVGRGGFGGVLGFGATFAVGVGDATGAGVGFGVLGLGGAVGCSTCGVVEP